VGGEEGPVSVSLSGGRKPMPGVRGVWTPGVLEAVSLFRRQERARTPARRITVPSAICAGELATMKTTRMLKGNYQKA